MKNFFQTQHQNRRDYATRIPAFLMAASVVFVLLSYLGGKGLMVDANED